MVYPFYGAPYSLKLGRNFVMPWLATYEKFDGSSKSFFFYETEAIDNLYGAQTNEGVYISAAARISVRPDPERLLDYIKTFRAVSTVEEKIETLLKSESKKAIEAAVSTHDIDYVMQHKNEIANTASENLNEILKNQPLIVVSFALDELRGPDGYEESIKAQALLRVQTQEAKLQQEKNSEVAIANNIEAKGLAEVAKTQATSQATVAQTKATSDATVAKTQADAAKSVAITEAESAAKVLETNTKAKAQANKDLADADAYSVSAAAKAKADATKAQGEAEASVIAAAAKVYEISPSYLQYRLAELTANMQGKWAEKWSGYSFEGLNLGGGLSYMNSGNILSTIMTGVFGFGDEQKAAK
jgi:regulator of protease activity HflC (stomatin/prohibitin superfamily)